MMARVIGKLTALAVDKAKHRAITATAAGCFCR
jgi:hypothetical protein